MIWVSHSSTCTPIGPCRHPDYIRGWGHIVVYMHMITDWHLPLSWLYSGARSYCSVLLPIITYTNWHLPSFRLYSRGQGHIVVNINMSSNRRLPSHRLYSEARTYCSVQHTSTCSSIGTCLPLSCLYSGRGHIVVYFYLLFIPYTTTTN